MTVHHAEVDPPATMGLVLIDPTAMTGAAAPQEEEVSAAAVAAVMARTAVATVMQPSMIKVPRKAKWAATTIITSQCRHKILTIRTATMLLLVPGSTTRQIHLAALIRVMALKVRLRVSV